MIMAEGFFPERVIAMVAMMTHVFGGLVHIPGSPLKLNTNLVHFWKTLFFPHLPGEGC